MSLAQKLDHKLTCIMELFTQPVEAQSNGRETAAAHGSLRVLSFAGRQQEDFALSRLWPAGKRAPRALFGAGRIRLSAPYSPHFVV